MEQSIMVFVYFYCSPGSSGVQPGWDAKGLVSELRGPQLTDTWLWADIGRQMVLCIVFIYSKERISVDSPVSMSLWNVEASHLGESLKNISFTNSSLLSFSLTTFGENWAVQGLGCWQVLGCRCFLLLLKDIRITLVLRWAEGECGILMWRLKNLRS